MKLIRNYIIHLRIFRTQLLYYDEGPIIVINQDGYYTTYYPGFHSVERMRRLLR